MRNKRAYIYYGPSHRYDGAPTFTTMAIQRMPGWECHVFECHGDPSFFGVRDLNVSVDWAADTLGFGGFVIPRPNVFWVSDTHVGGDEFDYRFNKSKEFDRVFCSIWDDAERFKKLGVEAKWLPYAAEPLTWVPQNAEQRYDVGFLGHYANYEDRVDFLGGIMKEFPNFDLCAGKFLNGAMKQMAKYKVVLNHCQADSVNLRLMEGMSAEMCVLTPATSDLPYLGIEDEVHCLTYKSFDEAVDKIKTWLPRENARRAMGERARSLILDRHTYIHRALELLEMPTPPNMQEIIATPPPIQKASHKFLPVKAV